MEKDKLKAILLIRNYLNRNFSDEYILKHFELAIDQLIENANRLKDIKVNGVTGYREGNQSITFNANVEPWTITDDVKMLLPTPYCKLY